MEYNAEKIAQWFINRSALDVEMNHGDGEYITNMKLQKMLYFVQGLSLAIKGKPVFKEALQAWLHGPVVKSVYSKYKVCGHDTIEDVEPVIVDEETSALLEFVYQRYGKYSASELRKITHAQSPYKKHYQESKNNIIPLPDIKAEFLKEKDALIADFNTNKQEYLNYAETNYLNSVPNIKETLQADEFVTVDWKSAL